MTAGYPAALSVVHSKGKYVPMIQAFTENNIKNWVTQILLGKQTFYDLPKQLPQWKTVNA